MLTKVLRLLLFCYRVTKDSGVDENSVTVEVSLSGTPFHEPNLTLSSHVLLLIVGSYMEYLVANINKIWSHVSYNQFKPTKTYIEI